MARFAPLALALLLAGCGTSPAPVPPAPSLGTESGGGGGDFGEVTLEDAEPAATPAPTAAPTQAESASPAPAPSETPAPNPTPAPGGDDDEDDGAVSTPTPAPSATPSPVATPTPVPSPTPTPVATPAALSLSVDASRHAVVYGPASYVGGPLVVSRIEKAAFDDTASQISFRAVAGVTVGRYGWNYTRIETVEEANAWSDAVGGPGPVCFLDSADGVGDNSGAWKVYQRLGEQADDQEVRATEHVTSFSPSAVAYLDLGPERTWTVSAENLEGGDGPYSFPGVFLVYAHPDGGRDFRIITGQPQAIRTRGYVYAFYLTDGANTPDQVDRLRFR